QDVTAAHGVAAQVVMQRVAPQHSLLAEVAELGVVDGAGGVLVIHRVAAFALRVSRLDDDVAAQVGDVGAVVAAAEVGVLQRAVERQLVAGAGLAGARLGVRVGADAGAEGLLGLDLRGGGGEDDAVADAPAGDRLGQRHGRVSLAGRGAELDPGAAEGGPVEVHPAAAADD